MSDIADYDADILLWSERQAALLRDLKQRARGLPNDLDLENVAEEIESVGRSQLSSVQSFLRLIFVHLLKIASSADPKLQAKWEAEITGFHADLVERFSPAMGSRIEPDRVWRQALRQAKADMAVFQERLVEGAPIRCPFRLDPFLLDETLDVAELLGTLTSKGHGQAR